MIVFHPVHLQRWAEREVAKSCSVACGLLSTKAARRMMIPGVQNPHWLAPPSLNAPAQAALSEGPIRWSVVTTRPATRLAGVTQDTRGLPSIHTVQQPH